MAGRRPAIRFAAPGFSRIIYPPLPPGMNPPVDIQEATYIPYVIATLQPEGCVPWVEIQGGGYERREYPPWISTQGTQPRVVGGLSQRV